MQRHKMATIVFFILLCATSIFYLVGLAPKPLDEEELLALQQEENARQEEDNLSEEDSDEILPTPSTLEEIEHFVASAEGQVNDILDADRLFIQLFGGVQRLSRRHLMEDIDPHYDVVKLTDGSLTFINHNELYVADKAASMALLDIALEEYHDTQLLYVQAPQKLMPNDPRLPVGVTDCGNENADAFLTLLDEYDIDTLDLRTTFADAPQPWGDYFFDTDHHWTAQGAFLGWQSMATHLTAEYGYTFPTAVTDPDSFSKTTYENWFLGSQGKRVGSLYAGVDDMVIWEPLFHTSLEYLVHTQRIERQGTFSEALLFPEFMEPRDYFEKNPYTVFAGGDFPLGRIVNDLNPAGPKVLILRDSFGCAITPFMALGCSELSTCDLRYWQEEDVLMNYIKWLNPDLVVVMYTPGSLAANEFFNFKL